MKGFTKKRSLLCRTEREIFCGTIRDSCARKRLESDGIPTRRVLAPAVSKGESLDSQSGVFPSEASFSFSPSWHTLPHPQTAHEQHRCC